MDNYYCKDCRYFVQHYTFIDGKLEWVYCGHCVHSKYKSKRPDKAACQDFVPGAPVTELFVSKEYLTKKLLDRVMNLELLPPIEGEPARPTSCRINCSILLIRKPDA